ncbi:LOW QUALITY PROTEIN: splicing regulatory glutamine/lysine-rich protein 1 [Microcaecilia unicolor]|uniref:Splicing regulatory glutamine/lysine-rich protein 1 n=1 Tax=Microcaecilia unicolor TaxID=1415580 RepID=A0A6P7X997_9AMPH|nr:LOW QUALITY PROTEIN: splicing regulatory glutamine/lysine-rich protein 1 [Microcaecilia unicolor]
MSVSGLGLGFNPSPTTVIQVTNLSAAVTSEQMRTLFTFLGDIEELRLYPPDNAPLAFSSKVCYVKFRDPSSVGVAQHLTNTVFIDRALIVVPCAEGKIPEEAKALSLLAPAPTLTSLLPGAGLLPIPTPTPAPAPTPASLSSLSVTFSTLGAALPATLDPNLATLGDIPQPPLMGNVDPSKVDEIRRTIYVGNLNSQTTTAEQLLEFFKQVGEVKFVRMAGDETQPTRFAFVEFADQNCVPRALAFNGVMFGDRPLKINHSNNAIVKPPELTPQAAAKELEEVMKRVREAQSFISAAIEPETGKSSEKKSVTSHSRTVSRSRSRSKSHSRRKRSRSKHRSRSRNRSRSRHKERRKSRSPHKKHSRSRERRKSRSHSRDKKKDKENKVKVKERERSRERDDKRSKEKRSRTPSKSYSAPKRSRSASRERRRRRSRSPSRSPKTSKAVRRKSSRSPSPRRNKKEKKKEKEREQSCERKEREQQTSKRKTNKDKDVKDKIEKNNTSLKENDNGKEEQNIENNKEVEKKDTPQEDEENLQQNGTCQLTEENLPSTMEVV